MHLEPADAVVVTTDANAKLSNANLEEEVHAEHFQILMRRVKAANVTSRKVDGDDVELHTYTSTADTRMQIDYIATGHNITNDKQPDTIEDFATMCKGEDHVPVYVRLKVPIKKAKCAAVEENKTIRQKRARKT